MRLSVSLYVCLSRMRPDVLRAPGTGVTDVSHCVGLGTGQGSFARAANSLDC